MHLFLETAIPRMHWADTPRPAPMTTIPSGPGPSAGFEFHSQQQRSSRALPTAGQPPAQSLPARHQTGPGCPAPDALLGVTGLAAGGDVRSLEHPRCSLLPLGPGDLPPCRSFSQIPGTERRAGEMTGWDPKFWCCRQALLQPAVAILMSVAFLHVPVASTQHYRGEAWREAAVHADFLSQLAQGMRETLEEWIGRDTLQLVTENVSAVFWIVSSGISAGLITLSGIAGQILSAFGVNGDHVVQPLKLGPAQVQTLLLWGLAAVVGYWLLSQLLGLLLSILGHVMWGLKVAFFLGCFLLIVSAVPNPSVQALLLLCLLTLYALLGRLSGARHSGSQLEAKVRNLEWQVEELRRQQRRVSPRNLEQDE